MFSWPLRHPALLALFFTFLGVLLAQYPLRSITVSQGARRTFQALLMVGLLLGSSLAWQEVKIASFFRQVHSVKKLETTIEKFDDLYRNPYSKYTVLQNLVPKYVTYALQQKGGAFSVACCRMS